MVEVPKSNIPLTALLRLDTPAPVGAALPFPLQSKGVRERRRKRLLRTRHLGSVSKEIRDPWEKSVSFSTETLTFGDWALHGTKRGREPLRWERQQPMNQPQERVPNKGPLRSHRWD